MIGQYSHNVDAKGRLFIPARFREELGATFYVTVGMDKYKFLSVFSQAAWRAITEKIATLPIAKANQFRTICGNAVECEPDAQGRILLPQKLRDYAGIQKDVVVVGIMNRCEIWAADQWKANEDENLNPELISQLIGELEI